MGQKYICLDGSRYDAVRRIAFECNYREVKECENWNLLWTDVPIGLERILDYRRLPRDIGIPSLPAVVQKFNHFPGMYEICRKDRLARNLNRMRRHFSKEFNFFPRTWNLPADLAELTRYAIMKKNSTFICKPDSGSQGKGIFLLNNIKKLNPYAKLICQLYVDRPLLMDGYKFDLRLYVLVTSCDPLRIYVYNEGIARFATVKYNMPSDENAHITFMHLTNYSLNKSSISYVRGTEGSKRKMSTVYNWLIDTGYDVQKLLDAIDEVVVKAMIAAHPTVSHCYKAAFPKYEFGCACFELLGFDILIDQNLKPYLLEVNHSPSFNMDLDVDVEIKQDLLRDVLNIVYLDVGSDKLGNKKRNKFSKKKQHETTKDILKGLEKQFEHERNNQGRFRLIFPTADSEKYEIYFDQSQCPCFVESSLHSKRGDTNENNSTPSATNISASKQQSPVLTPISNSEDIEKFKRRVEIREKF